MTSASQPFSRQQADKALAALRALADQAFSRAAGAPLTPGNNLCAAGRDRILSSMAGCDPIRRDKYKPVPQN